MNMPTEWGGQGFSILQQGRGGWSSSDA